MNFLKNSNIKILDCTIRDGGWSVDWNFSDEMVDDVYRATLDANIDYCEIGYISKDVILYNGKWRYLNIESYLKKINKDIKLSVFAHYEDLDTDSICNYYECNVDLIRVGYINKNNLYKVFPELVKIKNKGYETSFNITFISMYDKSQINK
jgi:4-hydroxy 2-oxovalerate aldolase